MSARIHLKLGTGTVLVGSDLHAWNDRPSTAFRAFYKRVHETRPFAVILNGDVIDASTISRYPPIGWEKRPTLAQELRAAKVLTNGLLNTGIKHYIWTLGNHDARFETRLASVVPEYAEVEGIHLRDHFPEWSPAWSVEIGGRNGIVIKHRYSGGIHAARNNAIKSGRSVLTGHLHSLKVEPITDDNGTRFGVDGGMLADTHGPQFTGYLEDNTRDWRSGFVELTFERGRLLWPEVHHVLKPGLVEWRGKTYHV